MGRQFTEHELDMQRFDDMREEEFLRAFDTIYAAVVEAMDEARERFENDSDIEVREMFPGTLAALDDLIDLRREKQIEDALDIMEERKNGMEDGQ